MPKRHSTDAIRQPSAMLIAAPLETMGSPSSRAVGMPPVRLSEVMT